MTPQTNSPSRDITKKMRAPLATGVPNPPVAFLSWLRTRAAKRRLQRIVEHRRDSAACVSYRAKRAAALLGLLRRPVA